MVIYGKITELKIGFVWDVFKNELGEILDTLVVHSYES